MWQGVNADDPEMRHVAYGDERGTPGSVITFFDMPGVARGRPGSGMVHRLLLRVADARALDFWERRLARAGVAADRVADQLLFSDPDGLALELVIDDGGDEPLVAYAARRRRAGRDSRDARRARVQRRSRAKRAPAR